MREGYHGALMRSSKQGAHYSNYGRRVCLPLFSRNRIMIILILCTAVIRTEKKKKRTLKRRRIRRRRHHRRGLMAAQPARARADYDYLIKLLLIGDSG